MTRFQCSSASRKFLNRCQLSARGQVRAVSVLFSEPKIPQFSAFALAFVHPDGFSALQRAENSSIRDGRAAGGAGRVVSVLFSEPKIPQFSGLPTRSLRLGGFSALQRAENSSMEADTFLVDTHIRFSALQRAENSSIARSQPIRRVSSPVSVLFSEPKIPQ